MPREINISRYRLLSVNLKCLCIYGKFKDMHKDKHAEICVCVCGRKICPRHNSSLSGIREFYKFA